MRNILQSGQSVHTESSALDCRVESFIGNGGQGEVYIAHLGGELVALKWYFAAQATQEQRAALDMLIRRGSPSQRFLWPMDLAWAPDAAGFGYLMPLREERFKGMVDLMKRRLSPTFRSLATAGIALADSFLQLHSRGLCYRDISFGNVFFDPNNGDVLICDNDNVSIDGASTVDIIGTPRFLAPEVVRGEAMPSSRTDQFSLAILLFYMLMLHHPLEGKREADIHSFDAPAMRKLYGTDPVFIWDPNNDSNRPVPGYQDNALTLWPIYPTFLQELFINVFTAGIYEPNDRVKESEWRQAFARLRDSIVYCSECRAQNFYDADALKATGGSSKDCWRCHKQFRLPARIRVGRNIVMLNHDTELFPHHIDDQRLYDFTLPVAAMAQHPSNPDLWGIKNLSPDNWVVTTAAGATNDVPPGRTASLAIGTRIRFGRAEGEIRL